MTARFRSGPRPPPPLAAAAPCAQADAAALPADDSDSTHFALRHALGPLGAGLGALAGVVFGALVYLTPP